MGLACTAVIGTERPEYYFAKWGMILDRCMTLFGPQEFVGLARRWKRGQWVLDPSEVEPPHVWAERLGSETGVFVDLDRKLALYCGGEESLHDPDWAATELDLMKVRWPGWEIRWFANDWQVVTDAVGSHPDREGKRIPSDPGPRWNSTPHGVPRGVVSFRQAGRPGLVEVGLPVDQIIGRGPRVVEDDVWASELFLPKPCLEGLHLDFDEQSAWYFTHKNSSWWAVKKMLPDWDVRRVWLVRDFEDIVGSALSVERPSSAEKMRTVVRRSCGEFADLEAELLPGVVHDLGYDALAAEMGSWTLDMSEWG